MEKKYVIEFVHLNGEKEIVELTTDRIQWSIDQWMRNRAVASYTILEENSGNSKKMLLG